MRYDDRLATVLRLTPAGANVARMQLRQLLDLLGTSPAEARGDVLDAAYLRLGELSAKIPAGDRAAMLGQPGVRLRSPRLVAALAHDAPVVAQSALGAAQLSEDEWLDLIPALPVSTRAMVHSNGDLPARAQELLARLGIGGRGLPQPAATASPALPMATAGSGANETQAAGADLASADLSPTVTVPSDGMTGGILALSLLPAKIEKKPDDASQLVAATVPPPEGQEGIGAIVRRIEAFRRSREEAGQTLGAADPGAAGDAPLLPLGDEQPGLRRVEQFDFTSDAQGRIIWCDSLVAPMVVGTNLGAAPTLRNAIRQHQPVRGMMLEMEGAPAIAGEWQVDAAPRFDPGGGRFIGHIGRFRRALANAEAALPPLAVDNEADRLRQLLHELRTPVNAIQGFAEIIQQQLFGPAPHEYRALAANIAADAARMLAGFEELERYARLASGAQDLDEGECDLRQILMSTIARLEPHTGPRQGGFCLNSAAGTEPEPLWVALAPIEAERLCWRLMAVLAATSAPAEVLAVGLTRQANELLLEMQLPAAQARLSDEELFHAAASPAADAPQAGMFGTGFTLRLARTEVQSAGGRLDRAGDRLLVHLPGLTKTRVDHSDSTLEANVTVANPVG